MAFLEGLSKLQIKLSLICVCVASWIKEKKVRYDYLSMHLRFLLLGVDLLGLEVGYNPSAARSDIFGFCWAYP